MVTVRVLDPIEPFHVVPIDIVEQTIDEHLAFLEIEPHLLEPLLEERQLALVLTADQPIDVQFSTFADDLYAEPHVRSKLLLQERRLARDQRAVSYTHL